MSDLLEELITEEEFARRVGVTLQTVRRWRRFGKMPWVGFGRKIKIPLAKALKWAETRSREPERARFLSRPSPPSRRPRRSCR